MLVALMSMIDPIEANNCLTCFTEDLKRLVMIITGDLLRIRYVIL